MKIECKRIVEQTLGRSINAREAAQMDAQIKVGMQTARQIDSAAYGRLNDAQRIIAGARVAARELMSDARRRAFAPPPATGRRTGLRFNQDRSPLDNYREQRPNRSRGRVRDVSPRLTDLDPGSEQYAAELARVRAKEAEVGTPGLTPDERAFIRRERGQLGQGGGVRGSIDLAGQEAIIRLGQASDKSTFFHESGHLILDMMTELAMRPDAPAALAADFRAVLDWLGVADANRIGRDQHEQFARGLEAYLLEGRPPTADLAGVFEVIKAWFAQIYRSLAELNVALTPEIRSVFDRILAEDANAGVGSGVVGPGQRGGDPGGRGADAGGSAGLSGRAGDQRPGGGRAAEVAVDRGGGRGAGAGAPATARGDVTQGRADLAALQAETERLEAQLDQQRPGWRGSLEPGQPGLGAEPAEKLAVRQEALRAAAFCLQHGG
jgi:hypothetical protein